MIQFDNAGAEGGTLPGVNPQSDRSSMREKPSFWPVFAVWVVLGAVLLAIFLGTKA